MRRLPSRSTRTATLLPDTTLFRSAVRGLGGARVGGGEIAMKDLEVGNGEPSQRVGPRREQRTHDAVVDTVPIDRGGTAVVVADRRRETGFDPAGQTVRGGHTNIGTESRRKKVGKYVSKPAGAAHKTKKKN